MPFSRSLAALLLTFTVAPIAGAQVIGPLRWQLAPYCNVVTITVTPSGGQYGLQGVDDQCGAGAAPSGVIGLAYPMPSGDVGMSLTTVLAPSATPVHTDVTLSLATLHGTWRDSVGNSGTFVFAPGAVAGGKRPVSPAGLRPGSVTASHLATNAVGTLNLANGAVSASKIANDGINDSTLIAPGTIELSDLNQQLSVGTNSTWSIPAGGCVARQTTSFTETVQEGDLLLARIQTGPPGVFTLAAVAGADGRFGYVVCNPTNAAIVSTGIALSLKRVPR